MAKLKTLPKYWYTENTNETVEYINSKYATNWDRFSEYTFIGYDGNVSYNGIDTVYDPSNFNGKPEYIPVADFLKIIGRKTIPLKNLILLKDMPTLFINDVEYPMTKGTVLHNTGKYWELVKNLKGNNYDIEQGEFEANKTWYALTTKQPTYEVFYINGSLVEFKSGEIKIGCQTVSNEIVKKIAKMLLK